MTTFPCGILLGLSFMLFTFTLDAQWSECTNGLSGTARYGQYTASVVGNAIYACPFGQGVFMSVDNGLSWTAKNTGLTNLNVRRVAASGTMLFACTYSKIFRSSDGGDSWESKSTGITSDTLYGLGVCGNAIYTSCKYGNVYVSTDDGESWTVKNAGRPSANVFHFGAFGSTMFAGCSLGLFATSDGGDSWTEKNSGLTTFDVRSIATNGTVMFVGTQAGGAFLSTDGGDSWERKSNGLLNTWVYSLVMNGADVFAGTLQGGIYNSRDSGENWIEVKGDLVVNATYTMVISGGYIFACTDNGLFKASLSEVTEVEAATQAMEFGIFPNPVRDRIHARVSNPGIRTSVVIYNTLGMPVYSQEHESGSGDAASMEISLPGITPGLYFATFRSGSDVRTRRFVVQR